MSYDITEYSGYIINIKTFFKDFPDVLEEIGDFPPAGDDDAWRCVSRDCRMDMPVYNALDSLGIHIEFDLFGTWYGDVIGYNPFEPYEVYICFNKDYLLDEIRKNGCSEKKESSLFRKLKRFMKKHNIPQESLTYAEWKFGG